VRAIRTMFGAILASTMILASLWFSSGGKSTRGDVYDLFLPEIHRSGVARFLHIRYQS